MPRLTRWYIKCSLLYFIAALLIGLLLSLQAAFRWSGWVLTLAPVYFHLLMVGWVTQLIFGMVYWMFPKYSTENPRGNETLAWTVFWLINTGLLLRSVAEPLNTSSPGSAWGWLLALSAVLQWLAALGFLVVNWPRVKEK